MRDQKAISCRKVRREVQEIIDRLDPASLSDGRNISALLPQGVRSHLQRCHECRELVRALGTFAPVLRDQLDRAVADLPAPVIEAALQDRLAYGGRAYGWQASKGPRRIGSSVRIAFQRLRHWLTGPAARPAGALRWAAVSLAVMVLMAAVGVPVYRVNRTNRAIRQQIDRVVEQIYDEPLQSGIETALVRAQPSITSYMEDSSRATETWFETTEPDLPFN